MNFQLPHPPSRKRSLPTWMMANRAYIGRMLGNSLVQPIVFVSSCSLLLVCTHANSEHCCSLQGVYLAVIFEQLTLIVVHQEQPTDTQTLKPVRDPSKHVGKQLGTCEHDRNLRTLGRPGWDLWQSHHRILDMLSGHRTGPIPQSCRSGDETISVNLFLP
jgi:hypothetical protein